MTAETADKRVIHPWEFSVLVPSLNLLNEPEPLAGNRRFGVIVVSSLLWRT
jgi:hypothetical protein